MGRLSVVANNVKVGAALQMKMNAFRFEHISDYRLRGVIDVDSAEHKKRLEDITRSNAVRKPILSMWKALGKTNTSRLTKDEYLYLHRLFAACLAADLAEKDARAAAVEEWEQDACGKQDIDFDTFTSSMVQLADVWTEVVAESAYIEFLFKLLNRITFRQPDSQAGGTLKDRFRSIVDIIPVGTQNAPSNVEQHSRMTSREPSSGLQKARPPRGAPAKPDEPAVLPQSSLPEFVLTGYGRFRRPLKMVTGDGRNAPKRSASTIKSFAWAPKFVSRASRTQAPKQLPPIIGKPEEPKASATPTGSNLSSSTSNISHGASFSAGQGSALQRLQAMQAPAVVRRFLSLPSSLLPGKPKILPETSKALPALTKVVAEATKGLHEGIKGVPEVAPTKADWPTPRGRDSCSFGGRVPSQCGRTQLPPRPPPAACPQKQHTTQHATAPVGSARCSARTSNQASARSSNEAEASGRSTQVEVIQPFQPSLRPSDSSILRRYSAYGSPQHGGDQDMAWTPGVLRRSSSAISWADQSERSVGKTPLAKRLVQIRSIVGRERHEGPDGGGRKRSGSSSDSDDEEDGDPSRGGTPAARSSGVSRGFLLTSESLKQLVPPNGRVSGSRPLVMGELLVS